MPSPDPQDPPPPQKRASPGDEANTRACVVHTILHITSTIVCGTIVNINMTAETPKHGDLVAALADLPPRKVEKFAIALGVPKNVLEESQINHPKDIYRVKSDALDWWIRNENASWEAVTKALEAKGVDERNLARRIRSSHGLDSAEDGKSI